MPANHNSVTRELRGEFSAPAINAAMATAMTGSWQQPKYPIHFCLRSMLATKLTDTPENTGKSFQQSKDTQLSRETYRRTFPTRQTMQQNFQTHRKTQETKL